jgi:redox-sensing transcriptional repressor
MSVGDLAKPRGTERPNGAVADAAVPERLSLGVAARLARYLQVLTKAKKEGKETISSQELSSFTQVNSTQIRRDLSGFGKFGKRGVGYNVDGLVSQIRKILRNAGQHNIALFGAGHLGRAIASSDVFADHGFRVVAIFDADPEKVGSAVGALKVRPVGTLRTRTSSSGCSRCPAPPPSCSPTSSSPRASRSSSTTQKPWCACRRRSRCTRRAQRSTCSTRSTST